MGRKNILMISMEYPPFLRGGVGTHVASLVQSLSQRNYHLYVLTVSPSAVPVREEKNITVISVATDVDDHSRYSRQTLGQFYQTVNDRFIKNALHYFQGRVAQPHLIHCHDFHGFPAAAELRSRFHVPIVCTVHLLHEPLARWGGGLAPEAYVELEQRMCTEADHLIAVCSGFKNLIEECYSALHAPVSIVRNGLELKDFSVPSTWKCEMVEARTSLGIKQEKILLFSGRFTAQKSIVEIIRTAHEVNRLRNDTIFLFAGHYEDSEYARTVRTALREYPSPPGQLRFLGKLSREDLIRYYQIATVALMPSLYEGMPYSALEAMALQVPVIATDTCGLEDLIVDRMSGLLIPLNVVPNQVVAKNMEAREVDMAAFTSAQLEVLEQPSFAEDLGRCAQEQVHRENHIDRMIDETVRIYAAL